MKNLLVYPNCSKGGVATVIRGRAAADPEAEFHCVFNHDRGGRDVFADLPNVQIRIIRKDRLAPFLTYMAGEHGYDRISILSEPDILRDAVFPDGAKVCYEFHSGKREQILKELDRIDHSKVSEFVVPSAYLAEMVESEIPSDWLIPVVVEPNLVDVNAFHEGETLREYFSEGVRPLLWIGRFDKDKGLKHFARMLSLLPEDYHGYAFVSLESDPARAADVLGEVFATGVSERFHMMMNVPQGRLGDMFRQARELRGALVSTSLLESFGYSVVEAIASGLPVHAFELPPFAEHADPHGLLRQVDIGDVEGLARSILGDPGGPTE